MIEARRHRHQYMLASNGLLNNLATYHDFVESSGNFVDKVGSYNSSAVSANYSETGILNKAVGFIKTDSDYVTFPTWTGIGLVDRSLSFWFKTPSSQSNYGRLVAFPKDNTSADEPAFQVGLNSSTGKCNFYLRGAVVSSASGLSANTWHHVVQTVDYSTQTFYAYLNGAYVGSGVHSVGYVGANCFMAIGYYNSFYGQYGTGTVTELGVYTNRILSLDDAIALYNSGAGLGLNNFTT